MHHKILFPAAATLLVLALIFGGGTRHGLLSDDIPQIFAVLFLFVAAEQGLAAIRSNTLAVVSLCCLVLIPLVQLVPLPAAIWTSLPGRAELNALFMTLRIEPETLSLSLRPSETWRSLIALMPAIALGLAMAALDLRGRVTLLLIALLFAALNVVIAFAQIIGGEESAFYFYEITNRGRAVGLFANANHYTAYLYATLPFAAALFSGSSDRRSPVRDTLFVGGVFILTAGLSISGSRTAVILGVLSLVLSLTLVARKTVGGLLSRASGKLIAAVAVVILLPILLGIGLFQIFLRLGNQDPIEDLRYQMYGTLFALIRNYMPFGSGFGSFERVYQMHEDVKTVIPAFVNHAHNDILEVLIEGGLPAGLALLAFAALLIATTFRVFRQDGLIEERIEKASVISLWLLLAHSAWDYPLRTIAASSLFALALGGLVKASVINVGTISDVMRHVKHTALYEWIVSHAGSSRRRRHKRRRRPEIPTPVDAE